MTKQNSGNIYQLRFTFAKPILALGGQEKSRFCLAVGRRALLSRDFGNLGLAGNFSDFKAQIEKICREERFRPRIIAHDLHPDYSTTRRSFEFHATLAPRAELIGVQHHHAHIASVLSGTGISEPVIGIAWDGTGYGDDGAIWGGEFLVADVRQYRRWAHLEYVPLPGGEKAISEPWRMAVSYLHHLGEIKYIRQALPPSLRTHRDRISLLLAMIDNNLNSPPTSSVGRLFDAVSALLGLTRTREEPARAAMELEKAAATEVGGAYPFGLKRGKKPYIIQVGKTFRGVLKDIEHNTPREVISAKFHNTLIRMGAAVAGRISRETGLNDVVLSGGVFQNQIILTGLTAALRMKGLHPIVFPEVPRHDGGLALGQAIIAHAVSA